MDKTKAPFSIPYYYYILGGGALLIIGSIVVFVVVWKRGKRASRKDEYSLIEATGDITD